MSTRQKISKGPGGACVRRRGAPVPWHNGTMASPSLSLAPFATVKCHVLAASCNSSLLAQSGRWQIFLLARAHPARKQVF